VKTTLIDTGPIVALLNTSDHHHDWAVDTFSRLSPPLLTCEAVLSEAVYLLRSDPRGSVAVVEMTERHYLRPSFRLEDEAAAVKTLLSRYRNVPMDLADACLVRLSEIHAECLLVTADSEFRDIYRRHGRQAIPTLMPSGIRHRSQQRP
jgi:predicted nucleic acid-binding protein